MPTTLNPYLTFPGTAREAMTFYADVLGGELQVMTFGETGAEGPIADQLMHANLTTPSGFTLMASDVPPGSEWVGGTSMSVSLSGDDADDLRGWYEGLSAGGEITLPLERQMWGDDFGAFTDRFGISWMVNIAAPTA